MKTENFWKQFFIEIVCRPKFVFSTKVWTYVTITDFLKLNEHDALYALHAGGFLQCKKCTSPIRIILSLDEYSWVQHVFKDSLEVTVNVLSVAVFASQNQPVHKNSDPFFTYYCVSILLLVRCAFFYLLIFLVYRDWCWRQCSLFILEIKIMLLIL